MDAKRCPFLHGTVDAFPFPGYVHGKTPEICATGCTPSLSATRGEIPPQRLLCEAREYCELFHGENKLPMSTCHARWAQIQASIAATGTYDLTFDELQYGARVAWRNAPKCSNRAKWAELTVADHRFDVSSNEEAFDAILELLETSLASGATTTRMAVFRAKQPYEVQGPRIWNGTLLRFAGYDLREEGPLETGGILGEPADAALTSALIDRFGWTPPSPKSRWDVLPLLLQLDETQPPSVFPLPSSHVTTVPIRHPDHPALDALGLRWFAIPVVSGLELSLGGLTFTAAPFVGWFADTEIVRDLTDPGRYNVLPAVAAALGLDTSAGNELWRDEALLAVNQAVVSSFRSAGMAAVSHHTLMAEFVPWYRRELRVRGYCPGNWKWIIPPTAASVSEAYLGLSKMTEYTLRPAILPPRPAGWRHFKAGVTQEDRAAAAASARGCLYGGASSRALLAALGLSGAPRAHSSSSSRVRERFRRAMGCLVRGAAFTVGMTMAAMRRSRPSALVLHASVSGTAAAGAARVRSLLSDAFVTGSVDLADFVPAIHGPLLGAQQLVLLVTSTYGSGAPPPDGESFLAWASTDEAVPYLRGLPFGVLGYGSSAYPRFCAAGDTFRAAMVSSGGRCVGPIGRVDALGSAEVAFCGWMREMLAAAVQVLAPADTACVAGEVARGGGPAPASTSPPSALAPQRVVPIPALQVTRLRDTLASLTQALSGQLKGHIAAQTSAFDVLHLTGLKPFARRRRWHNTQLAQVVSVTQLVAQSEQPPVDPTPLRGAASTEASAVQRSQCEPLAPAFRATAPSGGRGGSVSSSHSIVRVVLDISNASSGTVYYAPGDNVAIFPRQSPATVERAAAALGLSGSLEQDFQWQPATSAHGSGGEGEGALGGEAHAPSAAVSFSQRPPFPSPTSIGIALEKFLCLEAVPTVSDLLQLAPYASGADAQLLRSLLTDSDGSAVEAWVASNGLNWIRLFELLPSLRGSVPPSHLLALIPQQHPRYYSVSSCEAVVPGQLELTVALARFTVPALAPACVGGAAGGVGVEEMVGVCSSYLSSLTPRCVVELRAIRVPSFHLPLAHFAPVVAVASGSGLAPFRGFWQERLQRMAEVRAARGLPSDAPPSALVGPFVLVYGCRSPAESIYRREIDEALGSGAVTEVHYAYSRVPGTKKTYVQHLIAGDQAVSSRLQDVISLHPKAAVFVCGDGRMAEDVASAFSSFLGDATVTAMKASGRYHEDVFGLISSASSSFKQLT